MLGFALLCTGILIGIQCVFASWVEATQDADPDYNLPESPHPAAPTSGTEAPDPLP